jgi:hypothetical protein
VNESCRALANDCNDQSIPVIIALWGNKNRKTGRMMDSGGENEYCNCKIWEAGTVSIGLVWEVQARSDALGPIMHGAGPLSRYGWLLSSRSQNASHDLFSITTIFLHFELG